MWEYDWENPGKSFISRDETCHALAGQSEMSAKELKVVLELDHKLHRQDDEEEDFQERTAPLGRMP